MDCKICGDPIKIDPEAEGWLLDGKTPDICCTKECSLYMWGLLDACDRLHGFICGTHGDPGCGQMLKLYNFIKYKINRWRPNCCDIYKKYENTVLELCKAVMLEYETTWMEREKVWVNEMIIKDIIE